MSLDTTTRVDDFKHHRNVYHPCLVILHGSSWVEFWIFPLLGHIKPVQARHLTREYWRGDVLLTTMMSSKKTTLQYCTLLSLARQTLQPGDVFSNPVPSIPRIYGTLHPEFPQNVPTKRDVPNSFILVAWLRQIVYDKNAVVEYLFWTGEWWQPSKNQPKSVLSLSASCTCPFCFCGLVCVGRAKTNGWHNGCGKEP